MSKILKRIADPFAKKRREELIAKEEEAARAEFEKIMLKFGEEFNVQVIPIVDLRVSLNGIKSNGGSFNIVSNRRFEK